ncbi:MAG: winged helix-turn-helix transcriptional regulator [Thermoleophilaceae bacterium]
MSGKRTYGEACAAAHALDLIGERWAMLVVRELLLGPKRFTDLRTGVAHASPNVLAQRLRDLEDAGVVRRRKLPPPAAAWVYELTEWGEELEPVITALGRWGARSPNRSIDCGMSVDSHVLAMRTMFDPALAGDMDARFELRLGEDAFRIEVRDGVLDAERGIADAPDATISADPAALAAVLFHDRPLGDAMGADEIMVEGDVGAVERLAQLFSRPELVPVAAG